MSMRLRTTFLIILVVFAAVGATFFSGLYFTDSSLEKTMEQDLSFAIGIADSLINRQMTMMKKDAAAVARQLSQAGSEEELNRLMESQFNDYPDILALTIFNREGIIADYSIPRHDHELDRDAWYIERVYQGESVVSTPFYCATRGDYVVNVYALMSEERILSATMPGTYFSELLSEHRLWQGGDIFMINEEGRFIGTVDQEIVTAMNQYLAANESGSDQAGLELSGLVQEMFSSDSGVARYTFAGKEHLCAYSRIEDSVLGWRVAVSVAVEETPQATAFRGHVYAAVFFLFISAAAAFFLSHLTAQPFKRIEAQNREQEKMLSAIEHRDYLLNTANQASAILFNTAEDESIDGALGASMELVGKCVQVDRIHIMQNEEVDGVPHFRCRYVWSVAGAGEGVSTGICIPYALDSGWEGGFAQGKCLNGSVENLPPEVRELFTSWGVRSVLLIPLFIQGEFWGHVGFSDCGRERIFDENEVNILRSAGLMMGIAINRSNQAAKIREGHCQAGLLSAELEIALREAQSANQAKSSFLATMSHEIRTPLNAVVGLSELVLDSEGLDDEKADRLEKIHTSGMTILSIVNDILDISKIESGKFAIHPVRYDTPSMINDTVTLNIVRIGEKPITFRVDVDENLPEALYGDDLRVKQIFNNLLSNAFKYTNAGTVDWQVTFAEEGEDVWLISSIRDSGIGIRPEDMKKLFSDYNQVDPKTNRRVEGTGLGLAITKHLVEMMDGTITVESEYGVGTTFRVRLRQTSVGGASIGRTVAGNLMGLRYTLSKRSKNAKLVHIDLSYAHVLVVDDVVTNLDVVKGMLKPYGIKIDCASSGIQAIELVRAGRPRYNAVFMDHMMPGMDGIEATRIIREEIGTDYAGTVPIIALTANAVAGTEEMFLGKGFQDFISKPIDMMKLDAALREWVRDKEREKEQTSDTGARGLPRLTEELPEGAKAGILPAGQTIAGVELDRAMDRFGGDAETLIDILRSYATNTRTLLSRLEDYLAAENLADYAITVHGIKGSSYGIFAQAAGREAEALEMAAKAGKLAEVEGAHNIFIKNEEALLNRIDRALRKIDAVSGKPVAAGPDPAVMIKLRRACEAFDMDGVDRAMGRLLSFRYESGTRLVAWLREKVNNMAFEEISGGDWPFE